MLLHNRFNRHFKQMCFVLGCFVNLLVISCDEPWWNKRTNLQLGFANPAGPLYQRNPASSIQILTEQALEIKGNHACHAPKHRGGSLLNQDSSPSPGRHVSHVCVTSELTFVNCLARVSFQSQNINQQARIVAATGSSERWRTTAFLDHGFFSFLDRFNC